jgi:predicted methyltransferase
MSEWRERGPLLTAGANAVLLAGRAARSTAVECSLDLGRSMSSVTLEPDRWGWQGTWFPYLEDCRDRTIYHWTGHEFSPVARYTNALIKLVPTEWGPPTFEIDGIKMLPTAQVSPYEDAAAKVAMIEPRGKVILDTCGGLGYFAAWCLTGGAARVLSYEKNPDVLWLRGLNPWSPMADPALELKIGDVAVEIAALPDRSVDAILHDPPRFGIAGELYSQAFYDQLARVLRLGGRLFHYTGAPNRLSRGRDLPNEVARRLQQSGFRTELRGDGVFALRAPRRPPGR